MKYIVVLILSISFFVTLFCQEEIDSIRILEDLDSLLIRDDFDSCGNVITAKPFLTETDIKNNFTIFYFHLDDSIHLDMLKTLPMQAVPTEMFKKMPYYNHSDDDYLSSNENYLCPDDGCIFFCGKMISFQKEVSSYLFMVRSQGIIIYDLFNFHNNKLLSYLSLSVDIDEFNYKVSSKITRHYDEILEIKSFSFWEGFTQAYIKEFKVNSDATISCRELMRIKIKDAFPDE
ncbi:MAG: hypothetical protein IPL63_14580 [Saprospiraceae bacterium]|nr:hypothetical protein [Saprospiraceae bacterium]